MSCEGKDWAKRKRSREKEEEEEEEDKSKDASAAVKPTFSSPPRKRSAIATPSSLATSVTAPERRLLDIYTDGSCQNNHLPPAQRRAGVGVFFGLDDPRNLSEPYRGPVVSNNAAELQAVVRALQHVPLTQSVRIHTDSTYVIGFVDRRAARIAAGDSWARERNGELLKQIWELMQAKYSAGAAVIFCHVRGHSGVYGNEMADKLANNAWKQQYTQQ